MSSKKEKEVNIDQPEQEIEIASQSGAQGASTDRDVLSKLLNIPEADYFAWETTELPSGGFYYDGWQSNFVRVKPMTQAAEKALVNQRLAQTGENIDMLFRACVEFPAPNFDPLDLLLGDRTYLLYYIRGLTHGPEYEFVVTCTYPTCKASSTHVYDLSQLYSTVIKADPNLGEEPFKVSLPYASERMDTDVWVGLRFVRGRDINVLLVNRRAKRKQTARSAIRPGRQSQQSRVASADEAMDDNIELVIDNIMGVKNREAINTFVTQKMHARDLSVIREWMKDHSPGIETIISVDCPECANTFSAELPITESFFRPAKSARVG